MFPLTVCELGKDFNFGKVLKYSLLPKACLDPDTEAFLHAYIKTYIKEEVMQEGLTRT